MKQKILICLLVPCIVFALPVTKKESKDHEDKEKAAGTADGEQLETVLEYERYLKEVVEALESDPDFRKKLDKAPEADIRSGKIAQELDYVNHHVRSKLDEIKRREIVRLRELASRQFELSNDIDRVHMKIPVHLDHDNEHTFEVDDLRKLILKTSADLAEADKQRREEFKQYELQKEFEKQSALKELDEEHRKKLEEDLQAQKAKHNKHEKVHHPGNKAQLEEVWQKQDHMDNNEFDPRTFFMLHDIDGNGFWDETEVKALFVKELDKVYQSGLPEDDMRERAEEMERMREHVFQETDTNHDGLISFQEFVQQTKKEEFNKDPEWETVDNSPQFTHDEYLEFERKRQEEIQRLIAQGALPPHPNMPHGYYPNSPEQNYQHGQGQQQYHHQQPQVPQQQGQYHPQQVQLNNNQVYQHVQAPVGQQQMNYQQQHPNVHQQANFQPPQQANVQQQNYQPQLHHPGAQQQQPNVQQYQQGNIQQNVNTHQQQANVPQQQVNVQQQQVNVPQQQVNSQPQQVNSQQHQANNQHQANIPQQQVNIQQPQTNIPQQQASIQQQQVNSQQQPNVQQPPIHHK